MTKAEWDLINSLASQLQHFVDKDGKQAAHDKLIQLLDLADVTLHLARGKLKPLSDRNQGADNPSLN